jgi:hypothetical protein
MKMGKNAIFSKSDSTKECRKLPKLTNLLLSTGIFITLAKIGM